MMTFITLTISCNDIENTKTTLKILNSRYDKEMPITTIYDANDCKRLKEVRDVVLNNLISSFLVVYSEDQKYLISPDNSNLDYFYNSLVSAIFYYVDSVLFGNHLIYSEIKLTSVDITNEF